jgi:hypothetical protein
MFVSASRPRMFPSRGYSRFFPRQWWLPAVGLAVLALAGGRIMADTRSDDFGKDVALAPFVVNGKPLSVAIHARTKADRRYAEKFAEDAVEIAYETLGHSTGKGLVIVGAAGEPHPVVVVRKFLELSRAGKLDPSLTLPADEAERQLKKLQEKMRVDEDPGHPTGITFDTLLPALPLPLEGVMSTLYQLAWNEGFDDARIEQKLKALTRAELTRDEFKRYNWVFYVPPESVMSAVFKDMLNRGMKAQKMGIIKRAAVRSAVFVFNPVVKKGFDAMRKGILFMTILRAEGTYSEGDVDTLTQAYVREVMPDLKPGSGDEHRRALVAIEKQKTVNAEYAKDPFVKPARLVAFDPAVYISFEGEYTAKPPEPTHRFKREGDSFLWTYKNQKPRTFYPAGDRLLVSEDGLMTIRFLVDQNSRVTGVEERWVRRRQTIARKF